MPGITYFKPAGIPLGELEEVELSLEEAEALRLKELEGLEQEQGAEKMNVSRPTFQRILAAARQKVADAILNGKAIRIEGGNYEIAANRFRCRGGHEWDAENMPVTCPECNTTEVHPILQEETGCGHKRARCCKRRMADNAGTD
jgi:predicted DNA-binding protein (UPF0251 family)